MSLDEAAKIHEGTIEPLRAFFNTSGIFYYAWVIIAFPAILLLTIFYARFLTHLPQNIRRLFLIAGALFITGLVGMEMVGGYFLTHKTGNWNYGSIILTLEEFLENVGIVIFIKALLFYIKKHSGVEEIKLKFL
jgi:hypothetical protein